MLFILLVALIGSCLLPLVARVLGKGAGFVIALLPFGLFVAFVGMAPIVERGWVRGEGWAWAPSIGLDLTLRLDGFSFLFCLLITGIGGLVAIYSGGYLTNKSRGDRARFFTLILLFMTGMLGTVLADNMLVMLLFWEATSVLSFLLIGFDSKSARARRAAAMALQVTAVGGLALLAAVVMIGEVIGGYSMATAIERATEIAAHPLGPYIVVGIMIAAFTKSAQFPFHFWLPNAMQAPTPASAYLHSATMVKLGIYLLARFEPLIAEIWWGRNTLIIVACITMLVAAMQALRAESFKSALAYSTIASLGILMLLVGLDGPRASVAMIGFLLAHALYKAALFFCAGSVLHATGKGALRSLQGLRHPLPLTALASAGASLSMAGIPPFLGFVSKEFLFEAQLASSWDIIPLAIAVIVNAVMVGVAGVITLRPFFFGASNPTPVRHGESLSLVMPPLLLALAGLTISLDPDWITRVALRPAVAAVYGRAVDVELSVWHGLTPMLALSAVVISVGALIVINWRRIHMRLRASPDRFSIEGLWDDLQRALMRAGARLGGLIDHGDLRRYLIVLLLTFSILIAWSVVMAGAAPRWPDDRPMQLVDALIALIGAGGAIAATRARNLLAVLVAVGLTGFSVAITFMINGAPDLALTQFTVEALIVVLLCALLLVVPLAPGWSRNAGQQRVDAIVAASFAMLLFIALVDMAGADNPRNVAAWLGDMSYVAGQGRNVVNVILVDFRGFDTMGETAVIAIAALLAGSLLSTRGSGTMPVTGRRRVHYSFAYTSPVLFALLLAASVMILWRGHDQPGGGFVGGLVAALAFAVLSLARGVAHAERRLRIDPLTVVGAGLALAVLSGVPGMLAGQPFLTQLWWEPGGILPKLGTTMIFDTGVYLVVMGAVLTFLFGLQREAAR